MPFDLASGLQPPNQQIAIATTPISLLAPPAAAPAPVQTPAPNPAPATSNRLSLEQATNFFVDKGLTPEQAQGVAQRLIAESGGDPNAYNAAGGGMGAYGIAQDRGPRQAALLRIYGPTPSVQDQLNFAWHELNTSEKPALEAVRAAKTPQEAYAAFTRSFERPGGSSADKMIAERESQRTAAQGQLDELGKETHQLLDQLRNMGGRDADTMRQLAEARRKMEEYSEKALELAAHPPQPPTPQQAMRNFGGIATVLGIFGGLLTRQPLMASLNAGAAAMRAYNANDQRTYQEQLAQWKFHSDTLLKMAEFQQQMLRDTLYDEHTSMSEKMATLNAQLSAIGNLRLQAMAMSGSDAKLFESELQIAKLIKSGQEAQQKFDLSEKALKLREQLAPLDRQEFIAAKNQYQQKTGEDMPLDQQIKWLDEHNAKGSVSPENVDTVARAIANYQLPPLTGWTLRSPWGQAVENEVIKLNPGYQATQYNARNAAARAFASGRQSDTVRSFSVAIDHLDVAKDLGKALENGDVRSLNAARNRVEQEFGFQGPVDFNVAKEIVGDEVNKAILGGVGSLQDRENLKQSLSVASSPEQLNGVIDTLERLMAGQLSGYRRQFGSTGMGDKEFNTLLSPAAQDMLKKVQGKGSAQPTGGGVSGPSAHAGGVPRVSNQAEYDALPPGSQYIGPDGKTRTKQ